MWAIESRNRVGFVPAWNSDRRGTRFAVLGKGANPMETALRTYRVKSMPAFLCTVLPVTGVGLSGVLLFAMLNAIDDSRQSLWSYDMLGVASCPAGVIIGAIIRARWRPYSITLGLFKKTCGRNLAPVGLQVYDTKRFRAFCRCEIRRPVLWPVSLCCSNPQQHHWKTPFSPETN